MPFVVRVVLLVFAFFVVSCGGGGSSTDSPPAPPAQNSPPTADAGASQTVNEQTELSLAGTGNDSDGNIASYSWTQTLGESVTITNAGSALATFTSPETSTELTLVFELTVTDNDGGQATDTVDIIIIPVNASPTVDAGADAIVRENQRYTLNATASDEDGQIDEVEWIQTSGVAVSISDKTLIQPEIALPDITEKSEISFEVSVIDNEGKVATDSVSFTLVPTIAIPVSIEDGSNDVTSIATGTQGVVSQSDVIYIDDNNNLPTVVAGLDAAGDIKLLSYANNELDSIALNSASTLRVILSFFPTIDEYLSENPSYFDAQLINMPEAIAAANYIKNNKWSLSDPNFEDLMVDLLDAMLSRISQNNELDESAYPKRGSVGTDAMHLGSNDAMTVDDVAIGYTDQKFRTTVSINPVEERNETETYTVTVENENFKRWLIVNITDQPNKSGDIVVDNKRVFVVPADDSFINRLLDLVNENTPSATSEILSSKDLENASSSNFGVYVYAFTIGDILNRPTQGHAESAYFLSSAYTLLFDFAIPLVSTFSGEFAENTCFKDLFNINKLGKEGSLGLAKNIAASNLIQEYLIAGNYDLAAIEAVILLTEAINNIATDCAKDGTAELFLTKLENTFGNIKEGKLFAYFKAANIVAVWANGAAEHAGGNSQRFWRISNTTDTTAEVLATTPESLIVALSDEFHYSDVEDLQELSNSESTKYQGSCVSDDRERCLAYTFDSSPPYSAQLKVSCKHPVTKNDTNCKSITATSFFQNNEYSLEDFVSTDVDDNGFINFSFEMDELGEYQIEYTTTDIVDGVSPTQYINIQAKRAKPQIRVLQGDTELGYTINNGKLILEKPIELTLEDGEQSSTYDLQLRNAGLGKAYIDSIEDPENVDVTTDLSPQEIERNATLGFTLTYTPESGASNEEFEDQITLRGRFGEESVYAFQDQDVFSEIVIPVVNKQNPIVASIIGTWHTYEERYLLADSFPTGNSACHSKLPDGTFVRDDGREYNIFESQAPNIELIIFDDGTLEWGYLEKEITRTDDWSTCSITGEYDSSGKQTGTWGYRVAENGEVIFSFQGGLGITYYARLDPQSSPLENVHLNDNLTYIIRESLGFFPIRWVRQ